MSNLTELLNIVAILGILICTGWAAFKIGAWTERRSIAKSQKGLPISDVDKHTPKA